jgi:hypothetical protein
MIQKQKHLAIRRAALLQSEIDINCPITLGHKQMLINVLCEKYERMKQKYQSSMNRYARMLISPKIPHLLKSYRHKYPQAFKDDAGFPFSYGVNNEEMVILSPDVVVYFTQEEMCNIVMKAKDSDDEKDRDKYAKLLLSVEKFQKAKNRLRERQIHYATLLNMPKYNTYKSMLHHNTDFFRSMYYVRTGFDLLEKYKP